jgi:hypothetical protein
MVSCRLIGHRPFYARRYTAALNHEDRETFGRRPLLSLLPLKLLERTRQRR